MWRQLTGRPGRMAQWPPRRSQLRIPPARKTKKRPVTIAASRMGGAARPAAMQSSATATSTDASRPGGMGSYKRIMPVRVPARETRICAGGRSHRHLELYLCLVDQARLHTRRDVGAFLRLELWIDREREEAPCQLARHGEIAGHAAHSLYGRLSVCGQCV